MAQASDRPPVLPGGGKSGQHPDRHGG